MDSGLNQYLANIAKIPLLTAKEERHLIRMIKKFKDPDAREKLILSNQYLIINIAKKYKYNNGEVLLIYIQEGNLGLMRAIKKFSRKSKMRFSTYATYWIKSYISDYIANNTIVRLPRYITLKIPKIKEFVNKFYLENGKDPTLKELSKMTHIPVETLLIYQKIDKDPKGLSEDEDHDLLNYIPDDKYISPKEYTDQSIMKDKINSLLDNVKEVERFVLERHYGLNNNDELTLKEIGSMLGVSITKVRWIEMNALKRFSYIIKKEDNI